MSDGILVETMRKALADIERDIAENGRDIEAVKAELSALTEERRRLISGAEKIRREIKRIGDD